MRIRGTPVSMGVIVMKNTSLEYREATQQIRDHQYLDLAFAQQSATFRPTMTVQIAVRGSQEPFWVASRFTFYKDGQWLKAFPYIQLYERPETIIAIHTSVQLAQFRKRGDLVGLWEVRADLAFVLHRTIEPIPTADLPRYITSLDFQHVATFQFEVVRPDRLTPTGQLENPRVSAQWRSDVPVSLNEI